MTERRSDNSSSRATPDRTRRVYTTIQFGEYKPQIAQVYRFPRPVTRDNFASTLVTSFRVSGNQSDRHLLYFELLKVQTGFDYMVTIRSFLESGGWNTFSLEEQQLFMKNFDSVRGHRTVEGGALWRDFHKDPSFELAAQLQFFDEDDGIADRAQELVTAFEMRYGSLAAVNQPDFLTYLNEMHPLG